MATVEPGSAQDQVDQEDAVRDALEYGVDELDVSEAQTVIIESDDTFNPYY